LLRDNETFARKAKNETEPLVASNAPTEFIGDFGLKACLFAQSD
jgi:hypothetical protein